MQSRSLSGWGRRQGDRLEGCLADEGLMTQGGDLEGDGLSTGGKRASTHRRIDSTVTGIVTVLVVTDECYGANSGVRIGIGLTH